MTLPEVLIWTELRKRPEGLKFRRQHPAGPYVLDFYCAARRLAIEIDGEAHSRGDRPKRDAQRDRWLAARQVSVLHIPATLVLDDREAAIVAILAAAASSQPLHQPAAGSPPRSGED